MPYLFAWFPGHFELLILLVVVLLLFGNRLPSVARSLGRGIVEFKKGVQGIEEDIDTAGTTPSKPAKPKEDE
jgi:sec-independent protein translocase protein TatA